MKWVLIFVLFPTAFQNGREQHVRFDTAEQCDAALAQFNPERDHFKVCVPESAEFWFYSRRDPATKKEDVR